MDPVASVIIPVHDAGATLGAQLEALMNQVDAPEFEVVVVLNRCSDDSRRVAESRKVQLRLTLVEANERPSAAYARNVGASNSSAPILLFCDADDRVGSRWVAEMVHALEPGGPDFVGGQLVVDRRGLPDWIYAEAYQGLDGSCISWALLPYAVSASLGCRRDAFESVDGFDERFYGAGYEEVDFAARLLRRGFRIGEAPEALLSYRPRTTMRALLKQTRGSARNKVVLAAKEGRLGPPPTRRKVFALMARSAGHWVVRERKRRPHVVGFRMLIDLQHLDEERKFAAGGGANDVPAPSLADFAAPAGTPLISGRALQARPFQAGWYAGSGIEQRSLALVEAILPERGVFVDCGANVGVFTLAAALRVGVDGHVVAFEPDPRTRSVLGENLRRHGVAERVEIRSEAAGASRTRLRFNQYDNDVVSGLGPAPEQHYPGTLINNEFVDVVPLDDAVEGSVDMVKIDVEGFEPAVLAGATALLARSPNATLIVELNPTSLRHSGNTVDALLQYFSPARWALWLIDERAAAPAGIRPFDAAVLAFLDSADSAWYGNVLAVPHRRRGDVQALIDHMSAP